jgi:hypothetical protein
VSFNHCDKTINTHINNCSRCMPVCVYVCVCMPVWYMSLPRSCSKSGIWNDHPCTTLMYGTYTLSQSLIFCRSYKKHFRFIFHVFSLFSFIVVCRPTHSVFCSFLSYFLANIIFFSTSKRCPIDKTLPIYTHRLCFIDFISVLSNLLKFCEMHTSTVTSIWTEEFQEPIYTSFSVTLF